MNSSLLSIFNLGVRGFNLASKFILIIFLAKLLSTEDFGVYGIIAATMNFLLYFIGLDFYVYSNRELIKSNKLGRNKIVTAHTQFLFIIYLLTLPLLFILFYKDFISINYILPFYIIVILDHLNQELMRLLIVLKKPIKANILFFIRSGAWSIVIVFFSFIDFKLKLIDVLSIWAVAEILCLILSLVVVYRDNIRFNVFERIDWLWIKKGLIICVPFLIGTLCIKGMFTADRYVLEYLNNDSNILAAYVLFSSLAAATLSFMDAAVFSFEYPALVNSINKKDGNHREIIKKLYYKVFFILLLINFFGYFFINIFLNIVEKDVFFTYIDYFYFLMFIQAIYCLSMVPHYILYALGVDKAIIISQISAFFIFIVSIYLLIGYMDNVYALFIALILSFIYILFFKLISSKLWLKKYESSNPCESSNKL